MSPKGQPRKGVNVKTTVDLPQELWRAAKVRAIEEGADLRRIIIAALNQYLKRKPLKGEE
jgi:predicted HicB family RNase H-like nuclease